MGLESVGKSQLHLTIIILWNIGNWPQSCQLFHNYAQGIFFFEAKRVQVLVNKVVGLGDLVVGNDDDWFGLLCELNVTINLEEILGIRNVDEILEVLPGTVHISNDPIVNRLHVFLRLNIIIIWIIEWVDTFLSESAQVEELLQHLRNSNEVLGGVNV